MVDKTKHTFVFVYLLYWNFQQNQCLNIKTNAIHSIHRPMHVGPPRNYPVSPCVKTALHAHTYTQSKLMLGSK